MRILRQAEQWPFRCAAPNDSAPPNAPELPSGISPATTPGSSTQTTPGAPPATSASSFGESNGGGWLEKPSEMATKGNALSADYISGPPKTQDSGGGVSGGGTPAMPGGAYPDGTYPSGGSAGGASPSGGPPSQSLTEALTRAGIPAEMHPLIQGFSATEGKNPSGAPTLGWTDDQVGSSLDQHAQALSKQIRDRQSVAGPFPHGGSPHDQAAWMATVVGQQGLKSDFQGHQQPPREVYINNIVRSMPATPSAPGY